MVLKSGSEEEYTQLNQQRTFTHTEKTYRKLRPEKKKTRSRKKKRINRKVWKCGQQHSQEWPVSYCRY